MAVNKVIYYGEVLVDMSQVTVKPEKMLEGETALDASGELIEGTIEKQAAQTITPGTADKTIASGRYLTGTQTIKGDANLLAGNIKSGVSIFGVAGTVEEGEDVTAETTEYTDLLTDLEAAVDALPDAGSGSGGSVETCSVRIYNSDGSMKVPYGIQYLTVENGVVKETIFSSQQEGFDITIENVLCNSYMYFTQYGSYSPWGDGTNADVSAVADGKGFLIFVNAPAGGLSTAKVYDDD